MINVQRVRNLCLLSSLLILNLENELNLFNTWFTVLLGISSSRSPRTARLLSSVGDYVPCQKFAPAKTYRLWPGKFVNYPLLLTLSSRKLTSCSAISSGSSPRGSWVSVILCGTSHIGSQYLLPYYRHHDHNRHLDHHLHITFCEQSILAGSTLPSITNPMPSSLLAKCNHRHQFNRQNWPICSERVPILWNSVVLHVCSEALVL